MLIALTVGSITATGLITANSFSTTGTANSGSINTGILYLSTLMQSAGTISVGSLIGCTWTDKRKLDANGDGVFTGRITSDSITSNSITVSGYMSIANAPYK